MQRMVKSEQEASNPDRLTLHKTAPPQRYHYEWLYLAYTLLKLGNHYVLNPRNIYASSLFEADEDWLNDFAAYLQNLDFYRDYDKRPELLK